MHEPNCSSLPGSSACRQPGVLPATGVGLGMGRNRPKIRSKGVGKPGPPPKPLPEPGPEPDPGPHPGPQWTAQRPCYHGREEGVHLYVQGGWNTVTPRLKAGGGRYPTAVSP